MSRFKLLACFAAAALAVCACGRDEAPAPAVPPANALLAHVPPDTPYLSANLQPIPDDVIDRFLVRVEPVLQALQAQLAATRAQLETESVAAEPGARLALALLQELDGKLSRAGLESLGLDLQAPRAFYGLGAFPVYRMGLADAGNLRATVQRVLERGGLPAPQLELQGRRYWRIPMESNNARQTGANPFPVALYISILDDQLAAGFFPARFEDEMLGHLLGLSPNEGSTAADRLQAVNRRFGYTPYGTGELDVLRLADELMNGESVTGRSLIDIGVDRSAELDATCRAEIRQLLSRVPRVYSGLTALTQDVVGYRIVFETDPELAGQLGALVAAVPAADPTSARVLEFALGLKVGAVRDFLREKALAITETPYKCGRLAELNSGARQAQAQLDQPIPPLINNFQGLRLSLSEVGGTPTMPEGVEGVAAIHVEQPEMFVGMAQMFLPDLAELQLVKGGPPVRLPSALVPMPEAVAFAALGENAIGVALGASEETRLMPFLAESAGDTGTFLSVNYDTARYLEYSDALADVMSQRDDDAGAGHDALHDIAIAARDAYKAMAGRTDTRFGFTPAGVVIDSRMTFQ